MKLRPLARPRDRQARRKAKPRPLPASSSPTAPLKSRTRVKCWPWARARSNDKGELTALTVKVGDRVLFGKYSGQTVKVDGDELLVMKEDDLFAVVEK
jgi:chaperonin GroES